MIEFVIALASSISSLPGVLLALALAPRLNGRLVVVLAVIDLWLLLEVLEALAQPAYAFGSHAVPRLLASAAHVAFAIVIFRAWQQRRIARAAAAARPRLRAPASNRRPVRSRAFATSGREAA